MRVLVLIVGLVLAGVAVGNDCAMGSARIGGKLINVGDAERKALKADPDREVQLETSRGGAAGFRLDFYERGKTVQVYIRSGKVVRICHVRD